MKRTIFLALALLCVSMGFAQRTPTHPLDIKDANFDNLTSFFESWTAGTLPPGVSKMDDEFFISRVRPAKRIADGDYQVVQGLDPERKMCLWVPLDDPTSKWKALPRYCFEGDNFSMWSYVNIHGNWTAPWFRVSAGISDVAHKNGVKVGCVYSIPWAASVSLNGYNQPSRTFTMLTKKNQDGSFKYARQFVQLLKYYGIDGVGVNSEFHSNPNTMDLIIGFFAECHKVAKEIGWEFQLHWYDGTNDFGAIGFDRGLNNGNEKLFGDRDNITTDMMFANYNWSSGLLSQSVKKAEELGRSSYDYYAGFDIQGRGLRNQSWAALENNKISIGFWGAHSQSLIHQSATDDGTSDVAIQQAYLRKQELIFSGGNRNPANQPLLNYSCDLSNANLVGFHGLAHFLTAKSTIQNIPFVSRFNLGNGLKFRNGGKVTFDHKWHNIATQDIMPTWRWWIVDANESAKDGGLVKADLIWDDAWFGGSCLRLSGATALSRVKLFKTMLTTKPLYNLSVTYKMNNELETHAKLFVALKGDVTGYREIAIPAAAKFGEWITFTTSLDKLGLKPGDQIAMIGITVENTASDYNMLIGEIALRNPDQTFATVTPTVKEVQLLRGKGSTLDFKMRYASKEESFGEKTYNDEVDTWYYEIFMQQENQPEQLLTATTSWAAYVIDAPLVSGFEGRRARFGVRAVSPDGISKSAIGWSEYMDIPYDTPSSEIIIDRQIVKPGETFTVGLEDEMADAARSWTVINSQTGETVYSSYNVKSFTLSLPAIGVYDVVMKDSKGKSITLRGKIQVTPEATGAVPAIKDFGVDKNTAKAGEDVTYSYNYRSGEGSVSRAVAIKDPDMLMIPADVQKGMTYSYALWVKADNYAHDKQGTNLISKNTVADKWPHNNWGDLWVQIRPEWKGTKLHTANEVSFNTYGWTEHDNPNERMMSTGYSLNPGLWNHVVITQDNNGNQTMYFNGKKVAETTFRASSRRENSTDSRIRKTEPANIFIGGGGVYKAGFNGWVDEIQVWDKVLTEDEVKDCMNGYNTDNVPEGLQGYYTFESFNADDSTFANYGHAGAQYKAKMVRMVGSGGESTTAASYEKQGADNSVTGYPGVTGSLEVKTTRRLTLNGARISSEDDKAAIVTYATPGIYDATLTLTNAWGETKQVLVEAVTIDEATGINAVEDRTFSVFPNPFVESVNFRFAEAGDYTVNIFTANGTSLQSNTVNAAAGQTVNVTISAPNGLYLVQVIKDGKTYKTVKVIKK